MAWVRPNTAAAGRIPPVHDAQLHAFPHAGRLVALLAAAAFVVTLNETVMGVALPALMQDLSITATTAQWLTTAFLLTMAIVVPLTGAILTRFTLRQVFFAAMSLFISGSLLGGLAPGFGLLLAARIIQAVGTALVLPLLMATAVTVAAPAARGRMMGIVAIVLAVSPAVGPTASGAILAYLNWRYIFWLIVPFAVIVVVAALRWAQNMSRPSRGTRVDALSVALSGLAFGGLIYGLGSIGETGSGQPPAATWGGLAMGATSLTWYVMRQRRLARRGDALLDLRAFLHPPFGTAFTLIFLATVGLFGAIVLLPIYLQEVRSMGPLGTGLVLLPGGLLIGFLSPVVGRIYDRHGAGLVVTPGMVTSAAALAFMATFDESTTTSIIVLGHLALGVGFALAFTPLLTTALNALPATMHSHGSALINTIQQIGGATGTAMFITIMAARSDAVTLTESITAEGTKWAFVSGCLIVVLAAALSLRLRRR